MRGLTVKRTIEAQFTAHQWDLFDREDRDVVATALNRALEEAVNSSATGSEVYGKMAAVQRQYADLGADDSEAERLIDRVVALAFPDA